MSELASGEEGWEEKGQGDCFGASLRVEITPEHPGTVWGSLCAEELGRNEKQHMMGFAGFVHFFFSRNGGTA